MIKPLAILVGLFLLVSLLLFTTTYTVSFHEVVIKRRFQQSSEESIVTQPGLHFKLPFFVDRITRFDTRLQLRESPLETVHTADGQQLVVRAFLLWKVDTEGDGPLTFDKSYGSIEQANVLLLDQFQDSLSVLSQYDFNDLVGGPEGSLVRAEQKILEQMMSVRDKGILPVTVGISQLLLPPKTTVAVLRRMEATRDRLAEAERFKGNAEAERIQSEANTMGDMMSAFAYQLSEEIRAEGNDKARQYYKLMGTNEEFAIFLTDADHLEKIFSEEGTIVLPSFSAPFHLMNLDTPVDRAGIPQPVERYAPQVSAPPDAAGPVEKEPS